MRSLYSNSTFTDAYSSPPALYCSFSSSEGAMNLEASCHNGATRFIYTTDQVVCICETLYQARDYTAIARFFDYLQPEEYRNMENLSIVRAHLINMLMKGSFKEIYRILSSYTFDPDYHSELQEIWWQAHYRELEQTRCRPLGAVEKYRLRKKHPPPPTIWDGEETVYSFKENSRQLLKQFYKSNKYPSAEEKKLIANKCSLSFLQVSNWFKNRRQREKLTESGNTSKD